jgi:hypothetical protein
MCYQHNGMCAFDCQHRQMQAALFQQYVGRFVHEMHRCERTIPRSTIPRSIRGTVLFGYALGSGTPRAGAVAAYGHAGVRVGDLDVRHRAARDAR